MSLICVFTRSRADGWRYVCEKPGRPPLRSGGRPTSASLRWPVFHQASRKKRIIFSFGTWPSLFFSLSILRLTHRYLDRSSEPHFKFNTDMSQHRSSCHIALIERPKDIVPFTSWVSSIAAVRESSCLTTPLRLRSQYVLQVLTIESHSAPWSDRGDSARV